MQSKKESRSSSTSVKKRIQTAEGLRRSLIKQKKQRSTSKKLNN